MSLVNYLGTYETLDQVWEAYPEGGKEGDYLYIASVLKKWDKYASAWADPTEEDVDGSTIMSLEEDVVVGSSTLINYLGRFETLGDTLNAYPEGGNEGDYIYVGDDIYAWDKYANEWVVSLDAPLEVTISEEDIIPNSNTFINYLGGFVDRDAVWQKYPEGGKVGDYLYIASDLHIWDKYICNWVAATPPDESSQIRPIEHLSQEGVVEYSENYINYLGVFESIEQAWEAYPEGGKEGDYIIVGGEQLRWNKYTSNWGEYDPDASTPARPVATIYGDLHVHNDVIIGEDLYARILETFTTKKWVLEQGYISLDDVTSELVMSKIVPDNTTIEVRDGKLVVIGGGGGTADSVAWDDVTGKPEWIGDTKPTYTLEEIAGSNGDGFVTFLSDQTIEGMKNFANGAKFNGALLSYDEEKKAWVFPGNIIASGGITAFGSLSTPVASLFEALPIDGTTIKRDPVTNELYVDTKVVGGSGGGSVDPSQLEAYLKPYAKTADVASTYATIASLSAVTSRLNDFLAGSDTDAIINKWSELETFLAGLAETDDLATILSGKANKATTLAGYGITDAYTKSHIDSNFVTIGTKQQITGEKDFVGGFKVNGGLVEYNATLKAWVFNGDLLVTGGMAAFSNISGFKPSTITDAVLIDNVTIKRNADGLLYAVPQGAGGINEDQLADYLTTNGYATQSWVTGKGYITGITGVMVANALGYTPLSTGGGTITGAGANPLTINRTTLDSVGLLLRSNNIIKGEFGWASASGTYIYNAPSGGLLGIKDDGTPYFKGNTLLHSGNYSDYALPKDGTAVAANTLKTSTGFLYTRTYDSSKIVNIGADATAEGYSTYIDGMFIRFRYGSAYTTAMQIGTDGNVSIGGTTADELLHVYGVAKATLLKSAQGYTLTSSAATYCGLIPNNIITGSGNATDFWLYNTTDIKYQAANHYFVGGNVAFGGTTASEKLEVHGGVIVRENLTMGIDNFTTAQHLFRMYRKVGTTRNRLLMAVLDSNDIEFSYYDHVSVYKRLVFGTHDFRFLGGNVAIGGETASEKLEVYGNVKATGGITCRDNFRTNDNYYGFSVKSQGGEDNWYGVKTYMQFDEGTTMGVCRIGTAYRHQGLAISFSTGNAYNYNIPSDYTYTDAMLLDKNGNLKIAGVFAMNQSSDERLKKNIRKVNASEVLMSLGGVWQYEYVESEVQKNSVYNGTHFGLIYQNVKGKSLDKMCHKREDGMGALNYVNADFISIIAGATMENISEIEKLKRKIRTLENKVKQLKRVA